MGYTKLPKKVAHKFARHSQVNSIETKTGKDTYERWINGNKEGLKVWSDGIVPAIYTRKNNTLTYYECSKFEVDINHPFTGTEFKTYCLNLKSKGIKMVIKNHSCLLYTSDAADEL